MPDFLHESQLGALLGARVAGVDEAGRGPLAGPVLAAAVVLRGPPAPALAELLDDSKRLAPAARARALAALRAAARAGAVEIGVGMAGAAEIGALNILRATHLAMRRAVARLPAPPDAALVDGNLLPGLRCPSRALVGGDGLSLSVAAASVVAKELRDRWMARLDRRFPGYGWAGNSGYPTAAHREALVRLGASPQHRRGFRPVEEALAAARCGASRAARHPCPPRASIPRSPGDGSGDGAVDRSRRPARNLPLHRLP